jgi:hypothetical protein
VLKEGKSGEYAKKGHGARPFEDYVPIMFPCDGEVSAHDEAISQSCWRQPVPCLLQPCMRCGLHGCIDADL